MRAPGDRDAGGGAAPLPEWKGGTVTPTQQGGVLALITPENADGGKVQTRPQLRSPWIVPAWLPFVGSARSPRGAPRGTTLQPWGCNDGAGHSSVENRIQFDPIHVNRLELAVITSREACHIHSGQNG